MVIYRTRSVEEVVNATESYRDKMVGFYPEEWLGNDDNIAVSDGENVALLEKGSDGIYSAHYFMVVRGRAARETSREFLDWIFSETPIEVLRGLTPLDNLGARWMSRQLGFTSVGAMDTPRGPIEFFVLSKEDHMKRKH